MKNPVLLSFCAFLFVALSAQPASLVWDGNGATAPNPNGGTGMWDTNTTANWWDGAANVNWPALGGTDDDAVFGNTAGTVTVNGGVTANSLTFNTTGYTLTGATLTFNGASPTITNGTGIIATINAPIAGTVTKTGDGELNLATLNAGATLILNAGTTRGNTGGGIKGTLQINTGAVFRNTQPHVFDTATARIRVNGGTLTHGPATFPEYYVPNGTSAADPGVQMTGGLWDGQNRFNSGVTAHLLFNAAATTATFAGQMLSYQGGTQVYNVLGGTVPGGVDLLVTGNLGENFGGGTTHITKTGAGLMEISGTATLNGSGLFTLTQGTLRLTGATAVTNFGGSGVALDAANAAVLQLNAVNAADSLTFSKAISGGSAAAAVEKTGAGTVTLTNAKTYTAPTRVLTGTLAIGGSLGNTGVTVSNGATLAGEGSIGATGSLTFQDGARLRFDGGTAGALTVGGGGTGNLTFNGTTVVDVAGVTAPLNGTSTFRVLNYGGTLTGGAANLALANPLSEYRNAAFNTAVAGQVDLTFGTYDLTWSGAAGSAWDHAGGANWSNSPDGKYYRGDSVLFGDGPSNRAVNLAAAVAPYSVTFTATAGNDYEISGAGGISGATGLVKNGTGKATLATVNTYTGATVINAGTLQLGNAAANGSLSTSSAITNNGRLVIFNANGNQTQGTHFSSAAITGTGSLVKGGSGILTLNAANTYAGGTTVSQGTLQLNQINAAGTGGPVTLGDADSGAAAITLSANAGSGGFTNPITVTNNGSGTVTINQAQNYSTLAGLITLNRAATFSTTAGDRAGISGRITGNPGTLTFSGTRTTMDQTAGNASDFTGDVVIAGGTLQMNTTFGIPSTASVTVNPGALFRAIAGANVNALNGTGTIHNNSGGSAATTPISIGNGGGGGDFGGSIQNGSGADIVSIVKNGAGIQVFSGNNSYSGSTTINGGTLKLGHGAGLGATSGGTTVAAGAVLDLGGQSVGAEPVTLNGAGLLGGGALINSGAAAASLSGTVTLNSDSSVGGAGGMTLNGAVGGAGRSLTKVGAGTVVLGGNNTYDGPTTVSGGALLVDGTTPSAGLITVSAGAAFGGGGSAGNVAFSGDSTFAPGGIDNDLTLSSLSLSSTTVLMFEVDQPTEVTQYYNDFVDIAGDLVLNGTLQVTARAGAGDFDFSTAPAGTQWLLMRHGGTLSGAGIPNAGISGPALGAGLTYTLQASGGDILLVVAVPEAGTAGLLVLGLSGLRWFRRRGAPAPRT